MDEFRLEQIIGSSYLSPFRFRWYIRHQCTVDYSSIVFLPGMAGEPYTTSRCMNCNKKAPDSLMLQWKLLNGK